MADLNFRISPDIILGSYSSTNLGQYAKDLASKYIVLVDPNIKDFELDTKIIKSLDEHKISYFVFDDIQDACGTEAVTVAIKLSRQAHIDGVIAIGGGRTLNTASAIASLFNSEGTVYDFLDKPVVTEKNLPLICVPTTFRDPFMFAGRFPIIDDRTSKIHLVYTKNSLCNLSIFDPTITTSLTATQVSSMLLEMLCISIEAYISQKATFFSDMIAEKSMELLGQVLDHDDVISTTVPPETLAEQCGCLTSLAAGTSAIGAASLMALCINARNKIQRSVTTMILLPYEIEEAANYRSEKLCKAARLMHVAGSETDNEAGAAKALAEFVRGHMAKSNLPSRLKDLGLTMEQLSRAAEDAGGLDLINSLSRSMSTEDLFELVKKAY